MTSIALTDAVVWVAGYDFTTDLNQVSVNASVEELDVTTFGSGGYRSRIAGLKNVEAQIGGYWQASALATSNRPDTETFSNLGIADRVATIAPTSTATSPAYMFRGGHFNYEAFGQVGDVIPFSVNCINTNSQGLIRGQVAKAKGSVSATGGMGSVLNLGPVAANQYLYATFHVFSAVTTESITLNLVSDDNAGITSGTTVGTIGPVTTRTGTWMTRIPGPITDSFFLFNVTAITGTMTVAGAIGIGS